jgi:hypothetical protein
MNDSADDEELLTIVIRMAVLYRLQEREYGAAHSSDDERIFLKIRSLVFCERGLDERSRFERDPGSTCSRLLEDQSGFVEMLVNRTLAGRAVITSSDLREARRILDAPDGLG